jgi:putative protease
VKKIGKVTHYYGNIDVAILKLTNSLKVGDRIKFEGHGVDFEQEVSSMQINHESVEKAKKGDDVGLKVDQPVKEGTEVTLV